MTTAYVKEISTGKILTSSNGQDESNPLHVAAINNFVTSRGWDASDYEVGFATPQTVAGMSVAAITELETWEQDMANFKLSREVEDLITEGSLSMNAYQKTIYDAKVARRAEKP